MKQDCKANQPSTSDDRGCPYHCNHQCEKFPIGSVVYWVSDNYRYGADRYSVDFGTVVEHYTGQVCIQKYALYDNRTINGIPVVKFETPTKWYKLPKNWTYNTQLFTIGYNNQEYYEGFAESMKYSVQNPKDILQAINDGLLVRVQDNDSAIFHAEIDQRYGWRIIREYPKRKWDDDVFTINFSAVYATYAEAKEKIKEIHREWERQANLTDYEWNVERMDETLNKWSHIYSIQDDVKEKYRQWLLELKNFEDVEVRMYMDKLQWKYIKNGRWNTIVLSA